MSRARLIVGSASLLTAVGLWWMASPSAPGPTTQARAVDGKAPPIATTSSDPWECATPNRPVREVVSSLGAADQSGSGLMGGGRTNASGVERCRDALASAPLSYVPKPDDRRALVSAMLDPTQRDPLCFAWLLLDLDQPDARKHVQAAAESEDPQRQRDGVLALAYHLGEDPRRTWAIDQLHALVKADRLTESNLDTAARALGRVRFRAAAEALRAAVRAHPRVNGAIDALGDIRDEAAVQIVLGAHAGGADAAAVTRALGKLATPEAVQFLKDHTALDGAVEALGRAGDRSALPFVERALARADAGPNAALHRAGLRTALARLQPDPVEALMALGEDAQGEAALRRDALLALQDYDVAVVGERIVALLRTDADPDIQRFCIWLLERRDDRETTRIMIERALGTKSPVSKNVLATNGALLSALNKRLRTSFPRFEDLQSCLKQKGSPPF